MLGGNGFPADPLNLAELSLGRRGDGISVVSVKFYGRIKLTLPSSPHLSGAPRY